MSEPDQGAAAAAAALARPAPASLFIVERRLPKASEHHLAQMTRMCEVATVTAGSKDPGTDEPRRRTPTPNAAIDVSPGQSVPLLSAAFRLSHPSQPPMGPAGEPQMMVKRF